MALSQQHSVSESAPRRRVALPFIDTDPLFDVQWAVLLLPVWWWLGIEQFVWPVLFGVSALKVMALQQWRVRLNPPLRWFFLFMVAVLLSGFFVADTFRLLTYVRNLGAFTAGFLLLLIVTNRARSWRNVEALLNAALLTTIIAAAISLLAIVGVWRPALESVAGRLLPASAAATGYGQEIVVRTLGERSWFLGLGDYYRVSGLFLFSNGYSSVLVYALPFLFYKLGRERGLRRVLVGLSIPLLLVNLVYTTGRVATLGLLGGALYFALVHGRHRRALRVAVALALTVAIIIVLISAVVELSGVGSGQGVVATTIDAVDAFVFARGPGSFVSRFAVYRATLESFAERPLFGWGTERDVEGLGLPLGSHSEFFAALYRQGLFGFITFLGLLWAVWRSTRPPAGAAALTPIGTFLRYGRWFFVTSLINSIMTDPAVDSSVFVLLWLFIALLVAAHFIHQSGDPSAYAPRTH